MYWIAQVVGVLAVAAFLLSYQGKKRNHIIALNATSRALYIVQYLMLGALEGATMDFLGIVSSVLARQKEKPFIKNHLKVWIVLMNIAIFAGGMLFYENIFSILLFIGVMLHTSALWITKESTIRKVSFLGSPLCLAYNLANGAFASGFGDVLTMVSIGIAIWRLDIRRKEKPAEANETKATIL